MCRLLTWISDPQKEKKTAKKMSVYSYTILMPTIFYHLKTRYFAKNHPMHIPAKFAYTLSDMNNCEMFFL
jgi:hypothetical protein